MEKLIPLSRDGVCAQCGVALPAGTKAFWLKETKQVHCVSCHSEHVEAASSRVSSIEIAEHTPDGGSVEVAQDVAGGSAQREFEKRRQRERARQEEVLRKDDELRERRRASHPFLGRIVNAFSPKPSVGGTKQSTTAWRTGAEGERRVAEILAGVSGIEVLHDRIEPGKRSANIDHIVICSAGVFVIDAKKYSGRLEVREKGTRRAPNSRLYVNGRDRTTLTEGVLGQVASVRTALGDEWAHVPVRGVLCFVGCEWKRFTFQHVNDVVALWPTGLPEFVSTAGPHGAQADAIASHLRRVLKQAK